MITQRRRPLLESLEGRYAPAVASEVSGAVGESGRVAGLFDPTQAPQADVTLPDAPLEVFAAAAQASMGGGRVYFAPPALPDPLMSQIGRLPEPSLKFPASGGSGGQHARHADELTQLAPVPSAAPRPAEAEGEGEGEVAEQTPDAETVEQA